MPSDTSTDIHTYHTDAPDLNEPGDRLLPAGAGLALGVMLGTAMWGGIIALFMML